MSGCSAACCHLAREEGGRRGTKSPLRFKETNEIISACVAALSLKNVCIAKAPSMPTCLCSCVAISPQSGGLNMWGGGGWGSLSASQQRGTHAWHNQRHRGMTHSWFDWAVALIAHVSAISAQGAAAHMLTMLIQEKLIGPSRFIPNQTRNHCFQSLFPFWGGHWCSNEKRLDSSRHSYLQFTADKCVDC